MHPITHNTLFYGDNLDILQQYIPAESVDLIYLDPPFNSSRNYNVLFKDESGRDSDAQIVAFGDTWSWGPTAEATYSVLVTRSSSEVSTMISAMRSFVGETPMLAYLVMMAARLVELHRVLKPTGSLYLHCDPTASHYLKVILDTIFGATQFRNEIVWRRTRAHNDAKITRFGAVHDVLLFYAKSDECLFNKLYMERDPNAPKTHDLYRHSDGNLYRKGDCRAPGGRGPRFEWNGHVQNWRFTEDQARKLEAEGKIVYSKNGMPRVLRPVDLSRGSPLQDVWADIDPPNSGSGEILGYPTQKPLALLERIIQASSNEGDIILDPFCGCGTAIAAAQKLNRRWIGIDITHLSVALQKYRLRDMFDLTPGTDYDVIGEPTDQGSAWQLAQDDRYQFQWWALSLIEARPLGGDTGSKKGKKGSDKGIDGVITFIDEASGKAKRILIQVKSGHVKSGDIRDLRGTVEREDAAMGLFITLENPSKPMLTEAISAGSYHSPGWGRNYPKIQICTIADLLSGRRIETPPQYGTFKATRRVQQHEEVEQPELALS
jgi:site-specific DNA-methyltransferase (adenine-specific)